MENQYIQKIREILSGMGFSILAVADAEAINRLAPSGHRPEDHLAGAQSMLIFAHPLPLEVYDLEKDPKLLGYRRAYFESYRLMDEAAEKVSGLLEEEGFSSMPVPSYSPLVFNQGEPWGKLSFKHAAELAGLGKLGRNLLFIHPEKDFGNILRFGGALTTLNLPAGEKKEFRKICPASCTLCIDACPVGALSHSGINKTRCMTRCIKSPFMPPYAVQKGFGWMGRKNKSFSKFLEWFARVFFEDYGIRCMECLLVCPHFPGKRK